MSVEELESDTASPRFARNVYRLPSDAAEALAPLAEAAREDHQRNICVLGYAAAEEGGAQAARASRRDWRKVVMITSHLRL